MSIDGDIYYCCSKLIENSYDSNNFLLESQGELIPIERFQSLTDNLPLVSGEIEMNYRQLSYIAQSNKIIFFDFFALYSGPLSQRDYMVLAKDLNTVFIATVPKFLVS